MPGYELPYNVTRSAELCRDASSAPDLQLPDKEGRLLIFNEDGARGLVDQSGAEAWWSDIESDLIAEWEAEQEAAERWRKPVHDYRSSLADAQLPAELVATDTGEMFDVDPGTVPSALRRFAEGRRAAKLTMSVFIPAGWLKKGASPHGVQKGIAAKTAQRHRDRRS